VNESNGLGFPKSVRTLAKILVLGFVVLEIGISLRSIHTMIAGGAIIVLASTVIVVELLD
jgi:Na+/citrate or Na+/malate symporter